MKETHTLKILVCEEDLRVLSRLESWVKAIGEEVIVTQDGVAALEIFKSESPDIVLISQELKSRGGLELLESIKKINSTQATIFMLNASDSSVFNQAIDLQVDKYLNKPVEAKSLFQALESLSQEKIWHQEFQLQRRELEDYKDAIDLTFSVSKHDIDGKVTYVNDLFCSATSLRHQELMSGVLNPLENPNENMTEVWDDLHKDFIYRGRQVFKLDGAQPKTIDITAVAIMDEKDEVSEYIVFADDVTDIINAAKKIKNQELDSRLAKLNHEREINKVKDSFLTIFTHELKTPLNSIINFSEYVKKHLSKEDFPKKDRLLDQVSEINVSGLFMLDMISNLMEAMKFKEGNVKLNVIDIAVKESLHELIFNNLNIIHTKDIMLNCADDIIVRSDKDMIEKILKFLLSNALKYAASKVVVNFSVNEDYFSFEVMDDGSGFSDKNHVFDLFEQSDSDSMTREASGIGVGLYIVKQLCDKMSYNIEILDSEDLGGAKVLITGKREIA